MVLCDHLGSHGEDLISTACTESQNLSRSRPPGAVFYLIEEQVPVQTSVQALESFFA